MKVRIKFKRQRVIVNVEDNASLKDLRIAVTKSLFSAVNQEGLNGDDLLKRITLSLNGVDEIIDDGNTLLQNLGIVDGDLIHVINAVETLQAMPQTNTCEPTSVNSGTTSAASAKPNPSECVASSSLSVSSSQCDQEKLGSSSQPKDIEMRTEQKRSEDENKSNFLHTEGVTDTAKMEVAETEADNTAPTMAPPALFLHEGITPLLQELFTSVEINNQHDAIFIVLHILMSESGFSLRADDQNQKNVGAETQGEKLLSTDIIQLKWKHPGGLYKLAYYYSSCRQELSTLTCTAVGPYVMAVGSTAGDNAKIFQMKIKVERYVKLSKVSKKGPGEVLQNLKELSRHFKDQVAHPLVNELRSKLKIPNRAGTFSGLPAEMLMLLLSKLDVRSLVNFSAVCKQFNSIANDPELWRHLCLRDFKLTSDARGKDWKEIYKLHYREKKETELFLRRHPFGYPMVGPYPRYNDGRQPFVIPGMRGGVHDLFPAAPYIPGSVPFPSPLHQPGPSMRPRFDPYGPLPEHDLRRQPGRDRRDPRHFPGPSMGFGSRFL